MSPREFYEASHREAVEKLCKEAGTTFENFQQIACFGGSVSSRLAKQLADFSDGQMTAVEILYPQDPEMQKARKRRKRIA